MFLVYLINTNLIFIFSLIYCDFYLIVNYTFITKMCCYSIISICFIMCVGAVMGQKINNDAIGFPESEENPKFANKQNRQPVFIPSMCPVNELYYPGDQKSDWICDCRPGFLYHPATDKCWLAYHRGPCSKGQYLVLPKSSVIPVCDLNPCLSDNFVMWKGKCEVLGAAAPCDLTYPASVLWVNATTVTLDCTKLYVESRFSSYGPDASTLCPPGCKRSVNYQCMPDPRR